MDVLLILSPFILIAIVIIIVLILKAIINAILQNLSFDPEKISLNQKWVNKCFYNEAHYLTQQKYGIQGKPIFTKKGAYRSNYINDANKIMASIIHECCEGQYLSWDFCDYINNSYPGIRRKELQNAISDFIKERRRSIQNNMNAFLNQAVTITPEEFFEIKNKQKGDIVGVYIIHNETQGQYYVGQAKKLFFRINQHFTGHGNGDVYADYKYGDDFSIKILKLSDTGYDDIDQLERDMIRKYNAYEIGYNRTSGNG